MIKTEVTKFEHVRADSLAPGVRFMDPSTGAMWVRTAKSDSQGRVPSMSLNNYALANFGQAQMVWKVVA